MAGLGASNIGSSGFTIDLGALNHVQMSEGRDIVSVASGSRWTDVYNELSPYNLTVVGGRSAGVGVGGFLSHVSFLLCTKTGLIFYQGGISFNSHEHGFGSDNIVAYEVVLSDGSIVNASPSERGDLYWALKLGSTNYGIITRFELTTFPTTPTLWGGSMFFDISLGPSLLEHLSDFTARLGDDPVAMSVISIAYDPSQKQYMIWSPNMHFGSVEYPPLLSGLRSFEPFHSSMKVRTLVDMVEEVFDSAPGNGRAQWFTFTFKVDTKLPWDIYLKGKEIFAPILEDRPGAMWAIVVQPITSAMVKAGSSRNGGNPSGISEDDGNLFCENFEVLLTYRPYSSI